MSLAYDSRGIKKWKHSRRLFEHFLENWPLDERAIALIDEGKSWR
ncbi:MAG: hypothetical protein ACYTBJ_21495 [Planctomycetota bacterium]